MLKITHRDRANPPWILCLPLLIPGQFVTGLVMTHPRKNKRWSSKRNRNRSGSSSSEGGITPVAKRDRPDNVRSPQDNKENPNMATMQGDAAEREDGVSAGLSTKLNAIELGQEQLRQYVNQSLTRHSLELAALIDQKMASLRGEIDGKLAAIMNDLLRGPGPCRGSGDLCTWGRRWWSSSDHWPAEAGGHASRLGGIRCDGSSPEPHHKGLTRDSSGRG